MVNNEYNNHYKRLCYDQSQLQSQLIIIIIIIIIIDNTHQRK